MNWITLSRAISLIFSMFIFSTFKKQKEQKIRNTKSLSFFILHFSGIGYQVKHVFSVQDWSYWIDLFNLYVLFSHFRRYDVTLEKFFFQMSPCIRVHNLWKKYKPNSL